ncbi:MAG TPA: M48 family metalloprotease [Rectinemataceae bacterium]|nr:M48 family metalloprotease [Rectinemataceae bacterium]
MKAARFTRGALPIFALAAVFAAQVQAQGLFGDLGKAATGALQGAGVINQNQKEAIDQGAQAVAKSFEDITPEQEYYIGRAVAASLLSTRKVYDVQAVTDYLNLLGQSLALASDRPETFGGYHFLAVDSDEINAFAAPGGLILVTRGLLRCARNEDEVAAILAHEVSHVVKQHGLKAIKKDRLTKAVIGVGTAAAQVLGPKELQEQTAIFKDSVGDITSTLVNSGYSRETEYEADATAASILERVGYDPRALEAMLRVMKGKLKPGGNDFAKTHPDPDDRIARIEKALAGYSSPVPSASVLAAREKRYRAALSGV